MSLYIEGQDNSIKHEKQPYPKRLFFVVQKSLIAPLISIETKITLFLPKLIIEKKFK